MKPELSLWAQKMIDTGKDLDEEIEKMEQDFTELRVLFRTVGLTNITPERQADTFRELMGE